MTFRQLFGKNISANFENKTATMRKSLTRYGWNFECRAVQKRVNLVDLVKSFQTSISELFPCNIRLRYSRAILQFRVNCFSFQLSFRTPPVPSVFEDSPGYQTLHFCSSTLHNKVVFIVGLSSIMLSFRLSILLFRFSNCYHPWVSQAPFRLCGFSSGDSPSPVSIRFRMLIRYSIYLSINA